MTQEKTITTNERNAKSTVQKTLLDLFIRGYKYYSSEITYRSYTVYHKGTPDTYTGSVSDNGTITITKHEGTAPHTSSGQEKIYNFYLKRNIKDEESCRIVEHLESNKQMSTLDYLLIQKEVFDVLPCEQDKLEKYAPLHRFSGSIWWIIVFFLLSIIGLGGLGLMIFIIVTKQQIGAGWVLLIAYTLIGLVITYFSGSGFIHNPGRHPCGGHRQARVRH